MKQNYLVFTPGNFYAVNSACLGEFYAVEQLPDGKVRLIFNEYPIKRYTGSKKLHTKKVLKQCQLKNR